MQTLTVPKPQKLEKMSNSAMLKSLDFESHQMKELEEDEDENEKDYNEMYANQSKIDLFNEFQKDHPFLQETFSENSLPKNLNQQELSLEGGFDEDQALSFVIRDLDSGEKYDVRNETQMSKIDNEKQIQNINCDPRKKDQMWRKFWRRTRQNNERMWDYSEQGNFSKLKDLFDPKSTQYPVEINSKAMDGWRAIHYATLEGHFDIVKYLIEHKADADSQTDFRRSPLHLASLKGFYDIAKLLLENKAQVNILDKDFNSPLHLATESVQDDIVQLLLQFQADANIKNGKGQIAIELCNSHSSYDMLLIHTQNVSKIQGEMGQTPEQEEKYSRVKVGNVILNNGRHDHVNRLLANAKMGGDFGKKISPNDTPTTIQKSSKLKQLQNAMNKVKEVNLHTFQYYHMLGKGSFGEVFLVEKNDDKSIYAMKVLQKNKILGKNLVRYAKTEKHVMSIMKYPFITKLHYAFQTDTKLYLIMDYCPGGDLGSLLNRKGKLTEPQAKFFIVEVMLALEHLHKYSIIFRDLKPDNILIDVDGHAKLTDFGLSKQNIYNNLTQSFCGSIAYLPPEVLTKRGHCRTVDWYLLGVLLYELLVGIPPYYSSKRDELFDNIKRGPLKIPKSMSENSRDLIKQLLQRDPQLRLGVENDAKDIKAHPFFQGVDFEAYEKKKIKPPFIEVAKIPKEAVKYKFDAENDKSEILIDISSKIDGQLDDWYYDASQQLQ